MRISKKLTALIISIVLNCIVGVVFGHFYKNPELMYALMGSISLTTGMYLPSQAKSDATKELTRMKLDRK